MSLSKLGQTPGFFTVHNLICVSIWQIKNQTKWTSMTMFFIIIYLLKLKNFESKENLLIFVNFLHSNYFSA